MTCAPFVDDVEPPPRRPFPMVSARELHTEQRAAADVHAVDLVAVADLLDHRERLVDPDREAHTRGLLLEAEAAAGCGGGHTDHVAGGVDERAYRSRPAARRLAPGSCR